MKRQSKLQNSGLNPIQFTSTIRYGMVTTQDVNSATECITTGVDAQRARGIRGCVRLALLINILSCPPSFPLPPQIGVRIKIESDELYGSNRRFERPHVTNDTAYALLSSHTSR
jgi:hypothetical protein